MQIIRSEKPKEHYTVIRNDVLRDETISFRARGVLTYILSNVDNWRTDANTMSRKTKEGRQAIQTAINELRDAGYIESKKRQDPETGRWITEVKVFDTPTNKRKEAAIQYNAEQNIATDMVREIWEANKGTEQAPIAIVKIIEKAIIEGKDKKQLSKALDRLAKKNIIITKQRLEQEMNPHSRGSLKADKKVDWKKVSETL